MSGRHRLSQACFDNQYRLIMNLIIRRALDHEFCVARKPLSGKLALDESPDPLWAGARWTRLIEHYLAEGHVRSLLYVYVILDVPSRRSGFCWTHHYRPALLPWHWRSLCLDHAWRPLRDMKPSPCAVSASSVGNAVPVVGDLRT